MKKISLLTKEYRSLSALVLALIMGVSIISTPVLAKAETNVELTAEVEEAESDMMEVHSVEVSSFAVMKGRFLHSISHQIDAEDEEAVSVNDRNWQLYRTTYVFDQMNAEEKALYNELEAVCMDYAKSNDKDAIYLKDTSGNGAYYLPAVSIEGFEYDEFVNVIQLFIYSNPQYYFTTSSFAVSGDDLYLFCYPAFADGNDRAQATNSLYATVDTWLETVKKDTSTAAELEKAAHDLLCNNISYDYDSVDQMNTGDYSGDAFYTQSIYSAIKNHKSVCAGYSLTFELLMNASGIPAVTAYSDSHAWNKVLLDDGCWYAVDVTWDDCDNSRISYSFYNKSDSSIQEYDDDEPIHVAKTAQYFPVAAKDFDEAEYGESTMIDGYDDDMDDNIEAADDESSQEVAVELSDDESSQEVTNVSSDDDSNAADDESSQVVTDVSSDDDSNIANDESSQDVTNAASKKVDEIQADNSNNDVVIPVIENNSTDEVTGNTKTSDSVNNQNTTTSETQSSSVEAVVIVPIDNIDSNEIATATTADTSYVNNTNATKDEYSINAPKISKVKAGSKKCKITWKKVKDISGYELQLSTTKKFKKIARTVKVSESSNNVTVKSLRKKTTYYVRMRTYIIINGKRITSDWSGVKKVTVK